MHKSTFLSSLCLGISTLLLSFTPSLNAAVCGKVDGGPIYLHIDVLESGRTVKKINMPGIKVDSSYLAWKGVCLKPTLLYAGKGNTQVLSMGFGIGHYTPLHKKFSVTPSIGVTYTLFKTTFTFHPVPDYVLHLRERFRSLSPYIALEASYCFCKGWRVVGSYQYAWSHSDTTIKGQGTTKSNPKGANYGLMVECDLNNRWSINLGAAYNESLTKEKHGLRGYGARLGFAYWF